MSRIGIYLGSPTDDVSNINNVLFTWAKALDEYGYEIDLIGGKNVPNALRCKHGWHKVEEYDVSTPFGKIKGVYNHVSRYIAEAHPDVVLQLWKTPTHAPGLTLAGVSKETETVVRITGDVFSVYRGYDFPECLGVIALNNAIGRITLRLASEIVVLGPNLKSSAVGHGASENHIHLIPPPGPDETQFRNRNGKISIREDIDLDRNRPIALFVGRLSKLKGMHFLESVMESVIQSTNYQFVVVGEGPFRKRFREKFSPNNVLLPGYVSHNRIQDYYKAATVYVHPSQFEGIPLVILEALQSGLPVVARKAGDIGFILDGVVKSESEMVRKLVKQDWNEQWKNKVYFSYEFQKEEIQKVIEKAID
ncbi:glycosyltransferase family 4 protein [Halomarina salina]|uniref:Glycosyltransferase family 4 protein n=1 Tax=Halomarina salina TaxID=1872699 RepID=A0ABD5RTE6_9EURY|nr:glycosyltransferase family 4 protein [Halomarina salina]